MNDVVNEETAVNEANIVPYGVIFLGVTYSEITQEDLNIPDDGLVNIPFPRNATGRELFNAVLEFFKDHENENLKRGVRGFVEQNLSSNNENIDELVLSEDAEVESDTINIALIVKKA